MNIYKHADDDKCDPTVQTLPRVSNAVLESLLQITCSHCVYTVAISDRKQLSCASGRHAMLFESSITRSRVLLFAS